MRRASESKAGQEFTHTHWSEIEAVHTTTPQRRDAVLENLCRRYWKPVYCYLRARGFQEAEALDIAQDFFLEVVLGRHLFRKADRERGRFRAYLLHCLKNFVRARHRAARARNRSPTRPLVSINGWIKPEDSGYQPSAIGMSPEDIFHRKWAAAMLEQVIDRLRSSCRKSGLEAHFTIFRDRFIRPALERAEPASLESLAERFGLTAKQVSNRGETIRRRFRKLLLEEVRLTVTDEATAGEELRLLMSQFR